MKGIILAGGSGSRLYPLTLTASKQLQPVYDKPMVFYPLTTLIECGCKEICVITTPHDAGSFKRLLGSGGRFGITLEYREQSLPKGIAEAFIICESFIDHDSVILALGDNIFHGTASITKSVNAYIEYGATVFACRVNDPQPYGVIELKDGAPVSIEEKPSNPKSNLVVPGIYIFDNEVSEIAKNLEPSARGELEITSVINHDLRCGELAVVELPRGFAWLDAGTSSSLHEASAYVQAIERRTGVKVGCPEESALRAGFISKDQFKTIVSATPKCEYRDYLETLI